AVNIPVALTATICSIIGSAIGSRAATVTSEYVIHLSVIFITPLVLILFLLKDIILPERKNYNKPDHRTIVIYSVLTGVFIGFYDGFFGPGTGTFMTIAFNSLIGLDLVTASGTARLCNLGSNLGSLIIFLSNNKVLFPLAVFTAISGIAGNLIGSSLALKKGARIIKPLITVVMLLLLLEILRKRFF
ncbi:MAG: sulfite exporter TauE/SafE family protein, partial [Deltaproteobacteria bacterium]|nr:sulfite exporter TauE/SafE family protein [Deltaproteobacteria bacterium]